MPIFGQSNNKTLLFDDFTYDNNIKTVTLYPLIGAANDQSRTLNPPILALANDKFVLEFDDLAAEYHQFHVKILPCTSDWKQSDVSELEYLPEYNDFIINDYQVSQGTKVPYYHYRLELPTLKLAGNYLVYAYRERNKNDIIFSKRCMVYQNRINTSIRVNPAQDPALRLTHQQIDLEISYNGYPIIDSQEDLKILVRQNHRWDKTIRLRPTSTDEIQQKLNFQFFNNENDFPAGNEFRYFDNRSPYNKGMFVKNIVRGKTDEVYLYPAENRSEFAYIDMTDFNGGYIIDNIDALDDNIGADYNWVTFSLKSHELEGNKKVYFNGAFDNWHLDQSNLMQYDNEFGGYVGKFQLKQGIFNYIFVVEDTATKQLDEEYFEGNHSEAGNTYEVIVYHKPFGSRAEQIISYSTVEFNKR